MVDAFDMIKKIFFKDTDFSNDVFLYAKEIYRNQFVPDKFRMRVDNIAKEQNINVISGLVLSGSISTGRKIKFLPSGESLDLLEIKSGKNLPGDNIKIGVDACHEISCGGLIVEAKDSAQIASQFRVEIKAFSGEKIIAGREYIFCFTQQCIRGKIIKIKNLNLETQKYTTNIELETEIVFDTFSDNIITGTFTIYSKCQSVLIGLGTIEYPLRKGQNLHKQFLEVSKNSRSLLKRQKSCVLWMTGLSGAGKSSISNAVEQKLNYLKYHTYLLDGDNVRHGLNRDLGFTEEDRIENIRRIAEVARLMVDAGLIVITAFISPFKEDRAMARSLFEKDEFIEIYIKVPLEIAEARDPKGLYAKARCGELKNFTGIDSNYQPPTAPEITLDTTLLSIDESSEQILNFLYQKKIISKRRRAKQ